jgi:signal transduction histidine kinase
VTRGAALYRPPAVTTSGELGEESARVAGARSRAEARIRQQRDTLRPLGLIVLVAVVISTVNGHPAPSVHGRGLGVGLDLVAFAALLALAIRDRFLGWSRETQAVLIAGMGAAGVALAALQPRGATALAAGAAVWMAVARLSWPAGVVLGAAITAGLALALALTGSGVSAVVAAVLLCVLLGVVASFINRARAGQDTTELLLAQLEDAREEQLRAAAVTERGRIAGELHDVLAHSLSGAAIQLQGARKLAQREGASPEMQGVIDRAGELVRDGLADAREAVSALRGEHLPGTAELESLVTRFRADTGADVTLRVEGEARTLPADAALALYRGAQEALTNVARYAPGAVTVILLRYEHGRTSLTVEDRLPTPATAPALAGVGGSRGLASMRERLERAGGAMSAGPTEAGWRVELMVPR